MVPSSTRAQTKAALEELARLMARPPGDPETAFKDPSAGFKSAGIPERLRSKTGGDEGLTISGDENRQFRVALRFLSAERLTEHLNSRELETELWDLSCEFFVWRSKYRKESARRARVSKFIDEVTRVWESFECAFTVSDLEVKCPVMAFGGVQFVQWSLVPKDWRMRSRRDITLELKGNRMAIASASGGDIDHAAIRARRLVDRALDALRLGVTQTIFVRVSDDELMFRRSGRELIRKTGAKTAARFNWSFEGRPITLTINSQRARAIADYLEPLVGLDSGLSRRFAERIGLATRWIGASAVRPDVDDKVVALCTAIEALLAASSDHMKGEIIAIRSMLLPTAIGEGFADPFPLYVLYGRRSEIVHGSKLNVCGDEDYRLLHFQAGLILKHMMAFLAANKDVSRFDDLVKRIETRDGLGHAIAWFARYGKYGRSVVRAANERLALLSKAR